MIILQCNDYRRSFLLPKLNGNSMNHFIKLKNVSCLLLGTLQVPELGSESNTKRVYFTTTLAFPLSSLAFIVGTFAPTNILACLYGSFVN